MPVTVPSDSVDFNSSGEGPAIVLVPGSCSTGAAWRPVVSHLRDRFRCITTSLPGYGGSSERRTAADRSIDRVAEAVELVIARASQPVHLAGHSFGGLVSLAVALRARVPLQTLVLLEPPAVSMLTDASDAPYATAMRYMAAAYAADHSAGNPIAISAMIDFYGGSGTFAAWPERARAYAAETTAVNLVDWQTAFDFPLERASLAGLAVPTHIVCGGDSHPAMQHIARRLADSIAGATLAQIAGAAHFMIATHPFEVARAIDAPIQRSAVDTV